MNYSFIYVFNVEDKNKLLEKSYTMLKADENNNIYIFEHSDDGFEELGVTFMLSNTLTF